MIRRLIGALAFVAIGIPMSVAAASSQPVTWSDGPCADNVGITVVIDFQELGGGVNVRCVPGPVTSGLDALDKAGILWEGTQRFPALVCRIAGLPGPPEACVNAPPLSAYWGYWVAPRGGQWCFSSLGAGSRKPPAGTVEGWSFALNRTASDTPPPGFAPPPPIDGQAPSPLNRSDCSAAAPLPAAPTTTSPPPPPVPPVPLPTPTTVLAQSQTPLPPTTAGDAAVAPRATVAAAGSPQGAVTSTTATTTTASIGATSVVVSTSQPQDETSGSLDPADTELATSSAPATTSTVPLGTVDLGDDGRGRGGLGAATVVGVVLAAGLVGAGMWAARRRRALL